MQDFYLKMTYEIRPSMWHTLMRNGLCSSVSVVGGVWDNCVDITSTVRTRMAAALLLKADFSS